MDVLSKSKQKETICGYYCAACIVASFTAEDAHRGLVALEELLVDYSEEDARSMYDFLAGRNPEMEAYMFKALGSEV